MRARSCEMIVSGSLTAGDSEVSVRVPQAQALPLHSWKADDPGGTFASIG